MSSDARGHGTLQRTGRGYQNGIPYRIWSIPPCRIRRIAEGSLHLTLCVDSVTPKRNERASGESFYSGTLVAYGQRALRPSGCVARFPALRRPPSRREREGAMTPHVVATFLAMEGLLRDFQSLHDVRESRGIVGSDHGPATTCRRTGRWASVSRSGSKSVFQSRPRIHQMSQQLFPHHHLDNSTPLTHAPLMFPAHSLGRLSASGARCALEARRTIQICPEAKDSRTTALPGSHHAIAAREAALPTVPECRRTAGSGPAAAIPALFGVSLSQHCPGRRRDPTWGP